MGNGDAGFAACVLRRLARGCAARRRLTLLRLAVAVREARPVVTLVAEFVAHDSWLQFGSLNHGHAALCAG